MNDHMPCPMPRVLIDSLTQAFSMYENCFQNKIFLFQFYWTYSDNIVGPPSDIFHWTYSENIMDNPQIYFFYWTYSENTGGQPSGRNCFIQKPCYALIPDLCDVPVHMQCYCYCMVFTCFMHAFLPTQYPC